MKKIDPYHLEHGALIVVTLKSGMIRDIEGIPPSVTVRVVDYDVEGVEEEHLVEIGRKLAMVEDLVNEDVPVCGVCGGSPSYERITPIKYRSLQTVPPWDGVCGSCHLNADGRSVAAAQRRFKKAAK